MQRIKVSLTKDYTICIITLRGQATRPPSAWSRKNYDP